ncbi:hypothetical protein BOTBODRAFT_113772, partial [Botryobasidium botryosum FD-172 SS1]
MAGEAGCLTEDELETIRAFNLKTDTCMPASTFEKLPHAFPKLSTLPSLYRMQSQIAQLSGLKPVLYDCCINSCCCFAGPFEKLESCPFPKCSEARFTPAGKPRKQFSYLPIIPQLMQLYASEDKAGLNDYHAKFEHKEGQVNDVFDGDHYQDLLLQLVVMAGETLGHCFFSDNRDLALGLSVDGFCPFKKRKLTC